MLKKIASSTIALMFVVSPLTAVAQTSSSTSDAVAIAQLQALIVQLTALIQQLIAAKNQQRPTTPSSTTATTSSTTGSTQASTTAPMPSCSVTVKDKMVSWTSSGATSATSDIYTPGSPSKLPISTSGSFFVHPTKPSTYSFWFTGPGGTATCTSPVVNPQVIVTSIGTNSVTNTSVAADKIIDPMLIGTVSPWNSKNGQTVTFKWDVNAPAGYKLEIAYSRALPGMDPSMFSSAAYRGNFLAPATLDGTTGTVSGAKSSGNTRSTVPSHGTMSFVTDYPKELLLPFVTGVVFTLLDSNGTYVTQAVASLQVSDPSL